MMEHYRALILCILISLVHALEFSRPDWMRNGSRVFACKVDGTFGHAWLEIHGNPYLVSGYGEKPYFKNAGICNRDVRQIKSCGIRELLRGCCFRSVISSYDSPGFSSPDETVEVVLAPLPIIQGGVMGDERRLEDEDCEKDRSQKHCRCTDSWGDQGEGIEWDLPEICVRAALNDVGPEYNSNKKWSWGNAIKFALRKEFRDETYRNLNNSCSVGGEVHTDKYKKVKSIIKGKSFLGKRTSLCWQFVEDVKSLVCNARKRKTKDILKKELPYHDVCKYGRETWETNISENTKITSIAKLEVQAPGFLSNSGKALLIKLCSERRLNCHGILKSGLRQ